MNLSFKICLSSHGTTSMYGKVVREYENMNLFNIPNRRKSITLVLTVCVRGPRVTSVVICHVQFCQQNEQE